MNTIITELAFVKERFTAGSAADILIVALVIFFVLKLMSGSRANNLLRGMITAFICAEFLSLFTELPAFGWMLSKVLPAFAIIIPVVFAPEIRRAFERVGRLRGIGDLITGDTYGSENMYAVADKIADGCRGLSQNHYGGLIVLENIDRLDDFLSSGVKIDAIVSSELLFQIFYPNTPLHDGAVIIRNGRILAASCVMPLSSRIIMNSSPEKHMGLRHRASLGISEVSDCVVVVVSEETGTISIVRNGEFNRGLSPEMLAMELKKIYQPKEQVHFTSMVKDVCKGMARDLTASFTKKVNFKNNDSNKNEQGGEK